MLRPDEVAQLFGVSRKWVYEHEVELGAIRLGSGPKARMMFDPAVLRAYVERPRSTPRHLQAV